MGRISLDPLFHNLGTDYNNSGRVYLNRETGLECKRWAENILMAHLRNFWCFHVPGRFEHRVRHQGSVRGFQKATAVCVDIAAACSPIHQCTTASLRHFRHQKTFFAAILGAIAVRANLQPSPPGKMLHDKNFLGF